MVDWIPFLSTRASRFIELEDGTGHGGFSNYVHSPVLAGEPEEIINVKQFLPKMHLLPDSERERVPRALFVRGGHVHILEFGHLRSRLGEDYPYAMNDLRTIPYTYGLSAPLGTPIPSMSELRTRDNEIKAEIAKLVTAVNERPDISAKAETFAAHAKTFTFEGTGHEEGIWDQTAKKIMSGERPPQIVVTEVAYLRPDIADNVPQVIFEGSKKNFASTIQPASRGTARLPRETSTLDRSIPSLSSKTFTKAVVVCVALFSGVWILSEDIRRIRSDRERESAKR